MPKHQDYAAEMMEDLTDLMEQVGAGIVDGPASTVDEIETRVCAWYPETQFQTNVRFKDRTLPWATFVHKDPLTCMTVALSIAYQGSKAVKEKSRAFYHRDKEHASSIMEDLLKTHKEKGAVSGAVQLEPGRGWVVVLFFDPSVNLDKIRDLEGVAETKHLVGDPKPVDRGRAKREVPETPAEKLPAPTAKKPASPPTPGKDRSTMSKSELMAEYKSHHGRNPDQTIKKADLAKLLEKEAAARGADQGSDEEEDDADLL